LGFATDEHLAQALSLFSRSFYQTFSRPGHAHGGYGPWPGGANLGSAGFTCGDADVHFPIDSRPPPPEKLHPGRCQGVRGRSCPLFPPCKCPVGKLLGGGGQVVRGSCPTECAPPKLSGDNFPGGGYQQVLRRWVRPFPGRGSGPRRRIRRRHAPPGRRPLRLPRPPPGPRPVCPGGGHAMVRNPPPPSSNPPPSLASPPPPLGPDPHTGRRPIGPLVPGGGVHGGGPHAGAATAVPPGPGLRRPPVRPWHPPLRPPPRHAHLRSARWEGGA